MFPDELTQRLQATRVVAGFSPGSPEDAVAIATALRDGGIDALEVTLRNDRAIDGIRAIAEALPDVLLGVGTLLTAKQVEQVKSAGAHFGVSPGISRVVLEASRANALPFAPGIATPSELTLAVEEGCRLVKFFPAEASGGLAYLRSIAAPFASYGMQYFPFGGISQDNLNEYLAEDAVIAAGGSWLVPSKSVAAKDWSAITALAERAQSSA